MKIAFASDHAGFEYKERAKAYLASKGHEIVDYGAYNAERSDYPDFAHKAAEGMLRGEAEVGMFVCGSGIGIEMTANRHKGIRAANCLNEEMARLSRQHNNANVLCFAERFIAWEEAEHIIDIFLSTEFEGGRHTARVAKIDEC
jgi:ribose 5-phosphate isomerase B